MKTVFKSTGGKDPVKDSSTSYTAGDLIFQEGDLGTEMFIIQEGEVDIVKHLNGESHNLSHLEKGDFFGEMAVLDSVPRTADAVAATDVRVLVINGARFDEMLRKNPEVAVRIIRKYSKRLREANTLLERLVGRQLDSEHGALETTLDAPTEKEARHRLVDITSGTEFFFSKGDETTIGRIDPVTGILPDIDLTSVDANRSVSRRHAKIIRISGGFCVLEEVGTVNGTYVNDERIPTGTPVPVRNGDAVKVGLIAMKAVFD